MTNHHHKTEQPSDLDLKRNPGIGQTPGINREEASFEDEKGENTVEGDVMNDTNADGSINPRQRGHTNS